MNDKWKKELWELIDTYRLGNDFPQSCRDRIKRHLTLLPSEPVAYADSIAFESAMLAGKGCDVWPKAGDYEARTGRSLIPLYTDRVIDD